MSNDTRTPREMAIEKSVIEATELFEDDFRVSQLAAILRERDDLAERSIVLEGLLRRAMPMVMNPSKLIDEIKTAIGEPKC